MNMRIRRGEFERIRSVLSEADPEEPLTAREILDLLEDLGESLVRVPPKLENTLDRVDRGDVTVQFEVSDDERALDRLAKRLILGGLLSATVMASAVLYAFSTLVAALAPAAIAIPVAFLLWRSFRRKRGIRARPQFTRQQMRQRRGEE